MTHNYIQKSLSYFLLVAFICFSSNCFSSAKTTSNYKTVQKAQKNNQDDTSLLLEELDEDANDDIIDLPFFELYSHHVTCLYYKNTCAKNSNFVNYKYDHVSTPLYLSNCIIRI